MKMPLRLGDIVIVYNKYKAYIHCSGKDGCVIILYLVSGEGEEVWVKQDELIQPRSSYQSVAWVNRSELSSKQSGSGRAEGVYKDRSEQKRVKASG